jgi:hypothetical protein
MTAERRLLIDLVIIPVLIERLIRDEESASRPVMIPIGDRRVSSHASGVGNARTLGSNTEAA